MLPRTARTDGKFIFNLRYFLLNIMCNDKNNFLRHHKVLEKAQLLSKLLFEELSLPYSGAKKRVSTEEVEARQ